MKSGVLGKSGDFGGGRVIKKQTGLTCGMDYNRYPRSRSFVLGTNITF